MEFPLWQRKTLRWEQIILDNHENHTNKLTDAEHTVLIMFLQHRTHAMCFSVFVLVLKCNLNRQQSNL